MNEICGDLSWSPIAVAPSHAALAAVIGGFVFAGIVLTLGKRRLARVRPRSLTLLVAAFFVLMLDSFFFSVISGEQVCDRAWTQLMVSAGLLGIGTLGVFSGIVWLALDTDDRHARAAIQVALLARLMAVIVPLYLLITAQYYLYDMYAPDPPPGWLSIVAMACPTALVTAVPALALLQRGLR